MKLITFLFTVFGLIGFAFVPKSMYHAPGSATVPNAIYCNFDMASARSNMISAGFVERAEGLVIGLARLSVDTPLDSTYEADSLEHAFMGDTNAFESTMKGNQKHAGDTSKANNPPPNCIAIPDGSNILYSQILSPVQGNEFGGTISLTTTGFNTFQGFAYVYLDSSLASPPVVVFTPANTAADTLSKYLFVKGIANNEWQVLIMSNTVDHVSTPAINNAIFNYMLVPFTH